MKEVAILRDGPRRVVVPAGAVWDDVFAEALADLGARGQPRQQEREGF